ncbi:DUF2793 domain-containing protein [Sphingomonas tabacisoli]|uniref:DUF2793 domain-containing protein n=1 Tax=Sphingomonas tabacisoli TaxID=2249466 RepID=A0ABW4HZB2_9SPHN
MSLESPRLHLPLISAGQAQKELTHNEALTLIDIGLAAAVESAGVDAPPSTPTPGQCWIIGSAPTGVWLGQPHALACWTEAGWRFLPAVEGLSVWVKDQQLWAVREGSTWMIGRLRGSRINLEGLQVVGPQQPSVAVPSGGAVIDAEARAAIAAILSRLTEHGLIAA